jgi:hypothetical protein
MAPKFLYVVCEGQTEETFCNEVLARHFLSLNAHIVAMLLPHKRAASRAHKGGLNTYVHVQRYLRVLLAEHHRPDAWVTTLFDLYALPGDFPGCTEASVLVGSLKAAALEAAFAADVAKFSANRNFIPHVQVYEFEALLLSNPQALASFYPDRVVGIAKLGMDVAGLEPEEVNDGPTTAPSKRIIKHVPEYEGQKATAGPIVAMHIGLEHLRKRCPHFHAWISVLEDQCG